jgi:hypothetical protein
MAVRVPKKLTPLFYFSPTPSISSVLPPDEDAVKPPTATPLLEIAGTKPGQKELLGPYAGYWLLGAIFVGGIFVITLVYLLKK